MSEPRNQLWAAYIHAVAGDATAQAIADRIADRVGRGVSQPTVNRWLNGQYSGELRPGNVAAFAAAFDRPVLEAFVAGGLLTVDDARPGLDDESIAFVVELETDLVRPRRSRASRVPRTRRSQPRPG